MIAGLLDEHGDTLHNLIIGFQEVARNHEDMSKAYKFLDRILTERNKIRLLSKHQVTLSKQFEEIPEGVQTETPRFIGIYDTKFNPKELIQNIYSELEPVCMNEFGRVPELSEPLRYYFMDGFHLNDIWKGRDIDFKYIPGPLEYCLKEVLKNSMKAEITASGFDLDTGCFFINFTTSIKSKAWQILKVGPKVKKF